MMDALLQTLSAAFLMGAFKQALTIHTNQLLHAQKLEEHEERLDKIENRPACPHT